MKFLMLLAFALPASAAVTVNVDCGSYGPRADNLAVQSDAFEESHTLGYTNIGGFYGFSKIAGCERFHLKDRLVFCDGVAIGTIGDYSTDGHEAPSAPLTLNADVAVEITGSCKPADKNPVTFKIINKGSGQCVDWIQPTRSTR